MSSTETTIKLIESLSDQYRGVDSISELDQATVAFVSQRLNADLSLIAQKENGNLQPLATIPEDWTDSDELLSPVSIPSSTISQGKSCIVDDRSDVRCAVATESIQNTPTVDYRSIVVTPFGDDSMILAGSRSPGAFEDSDLDVLQIISAFASSIKSQMESVENHSQQEHMEGAAAILSHDAGNFLSIIQGNLELARDDPKDEYFEVIERGSQRLDELIEDTSTLLRTGKQVADLQPLDLHRMITRAWEDVETDQATLIRGQLGKIKADKSSLCELLENVFRNSVEHGGPEVSIWVGLLDEEDGFYVEDNGPGLEPSETDDIFEVGFSSKEDSEGLGLAIVKRIAEAHGWEVSASNGEMGGFRLEFSNVDLLD